MKTLHVSVVGKVATYQNRDGDIVCGNSDYQIVFAFDSDWDSYTEKTARFIWNGQYVDVDFSSGTCPVPIITGTTLVEIGVYAGNLSTTTSAIIPAKKSILCGGETPSVENDRDYANEAKEAADRAEEAAERAEASAGGTSVDVERRLSELERQIADINYKAITITSFSASPTTAEIGSTVVSVALSWGVSKTPTTLTLDGATLDVNTKSKNVTGTFKANKTWTLKATDERGAVATKSASLTFLNGVYYGVGKKPTTYDSAFILGLTKELRGSHKPSFTVTAGEGEYIFYCSPTRFGGAGFAVGGFDGGFTYVNTISFTNASGHSETYYIYRSDNPSLGATTVTVS